jgi:uncharacterized protein YjbI with pentapeptide repeats
MIRVLIAVVAIGLMSLSAFAQPAGAQAPEQNEAARNATAQRVIGGAKSCVGCDLFQVDFSYKALDGRDFSGARLRQADFSLATLDGANLRGANLSVANAFGARFAKTDFTNADLSDATLVGSWFGGAVMSGANLKGANLSGSYLFTAKGLTQAQLSSACGDEATQLPAGLTIALCPGAEPAPQLRGLTRTGG